MQSIVNDQRGRVIDVRTTLQQVGTMTLMSCGAQLKTLVYDTDYVKFKVSRKYWLTIKLNAQDLFDLEVGKLRNRQGLLEYIVIEQVKDVPVEALSKYVREIGDRA